MPHDESDELFPGDIGTDVHLSKPKSTSDQDVIDFCGNVIRAVDHMKQSQIAVKTLAKAQDKRLNSHDQDLTELRESRRHIESSVEGVEKALTGDRFGNKGIVTMQREMAESMREDKEAIFDRLNKNEQRIGIGVVIVAIIGAVGQAWLSGKF